MKLSSILLTLTLFARADKPPVIPADQQIEAWRAAAVVAQMRPGWEAANADDQAALAALRKACGDKYQPQLDGKRLVCVLKPPQGKK